MKQFFTLLLLVSLWSVALGQEETHEPAIVYEGIGKVVLEDGTEITGMVHHSRITQRRVSVTPEGGEEQTFKTKEVSNFFIGGLHFIKVETEGVGVKDPDFGLLLSDEGAAIKVYEVTFQRNLGSSTGGETLWPTNRGYYVYLPKREKLKAVGDVAYMPSKKIAKWIEGCPELEKKLNDKAKGYNYGLISNDAMKRDVFLNISKDYQNCQ